MKRKIALSALAFLLINTLSVAQIGSPHFISANFGTNLPVGDYQEVDSIASSGANTGIYYSFEAGAYFSKVLGVALNIGAFSNAVDEEGIKDQLKRELSSNNQLSVNSDNWVNGYIMLGPILSLGSEKVIVDVKLLGGIMNSAKPFINVETNNGVTTTSVNQSNEVTTSSLGINYGLHLRLKLIGKLGLRINAEGFMSSQEFETRVSETDILTNETDITTQKLEKEIQALNLGVGLILTL